MDDPEKFDWRTHLPSHWNVLCRSIVIFWRGHGWIRVISLILCARRFILASNTRRLAPNCVPTLKRCSSRHSTIKNNRYRHVLGGTCNFSLHDSCAGVGAGSDFSFHRKSSGNDGDSLSGNRKFPPLSCAPQSIIASFARAH